METISHLQGETAFELLKRCGGHYRSPVNDEGNFIGPLVGYAGKYRVEHVSGPIQRQYVGFEYANFAAIERHGPARVWVARSLLASIGFAHTGRNLSIDSLPTGVTGFVGAPEGGKALADTMSTLSGSQYIFPDKVVLEAKTDSQREKSKLVWGRHAPESGEQWVLSEDICNNFSTTADMVNLIEMTGAKVVAISCFLNRTVIPEFKVFFDLPDGRKIPIVALERREIPEYKQDDPAVVDLVKAGHVFWKPKDCWNELMIAMEVTK